VDPAAVDALVDVLLHWNVGFGRHRRSRRLSPVRGAQVGVSRLFCATGSWRRWRAEADHICGDCGSLNEC